MKRFCLSLLLLLAMSANANAQFGWSCDWDTDPAMLTTPGNPNVFIDWTTYVDVPQQAVTPLKVELQYQLFYIEQGPNGPVQLWKWHTFDSSLHTWAAGLVSQELSSQENGWVPWVVEPDGSKFLMFRKQASIASPSTGEYVPFTWSPTWKATLSAQGIPGIQLDEQAGGGL